MIVYTLSTIGIVFGLVIMILMDSYLLHRTILQIVVLSHKNAFLDLFQVLFGFHPQLPLLDTDLIYLFCVLFFFDVALNSLFLGNLVSLIKFLLIVLDKLLLSCSLLLDNLIVVLA